ncbi:MAG: DUF935 domain-containing protein, partial [Tannerellaceae bacterium]|nr:DUF935 domain-containing protein [Tannerellaceae bacterium]
MAKKETKSKNPAPVISTLVVRAPQRKTSDVAYWRNALKSADGGYIMRLYDMYEDLLIDGVLADAHSKRIEAVTNAELIFQGARGENVPEIAALMETLDWEVMIKEFVQPVFWGRAGVEFDFTGGFRATPIPKKHISLETGKILIEAGGDTGVSYADDDHLLVLGNTRDWGLFLRTAPYIIWKRGGFGDWAEWLEIFGMPQRVGKYNTYDPQSRILLEEALEKSGSAPWCVIPDGSNVETVNNTGSGSSGTSYADFRNACNEELLIAMLGQTLTTLQGERGARSLGEVHKKVEEGKNKADMRYVEKVLNTYLVPRLESRGYPVKGGRFVFPEATESISVADIVSLSDILDIPVKFLYDKYGIPVPKDGERIAAQRMQQDTKEPDNAKSAPAGKKDAEPEPEPEPEPAPAVKAKGKEVKNSDRGFFSLLTDFFADAPARWNGAIRRFTGRLTSSTGTVTLADDYSI